MFVNKPIQDHETNHWVILIRETRSPLSDIIERLEFDNYRSAHQAYAQFMRNEGKWL